MPSDNDVPTVKPAWMSPIETRQARADYYFRTVLDGQREWYSKGAGKQKRRYLAFAICVIVLGVLISLLHVLDTAVWVRFGGVGLFHIPDLIKVIKPGSNRTQTMGNVGRGEGCHGNHRRRFSCFWRREAECERQAAPGRN